MKKLLTTLCILAAFWAICTSATACRLFKNNSQIASEEVSQMDILPVPDTVEKVKDIDLLPTMNSESKSPNRIWVGTFQIVWNEVVDNLIKSPIEFESGYNKTADDLNKREFNKNDISDDSYYTTWGIISPDLKTRIENGIKEKFNETSDILGLIDFTYDPQKYMFYAMLKKDFKFLEPFDKLPDGKFGENPNPVKFFGIDANSDGSLYKNVSVLFYNKHDDYAVSIHTKGNDEVILYRTNDDKKFNEYYSDITDKTREFDGSQFFGNYDRLKVPDINLYQMTSFSDVEGKKIKGADFLIDQTIETVDFRMNNEGVKLKSEAAIVMKCTSMPGPRPQIRYFYFNDNFVLFLIEKGKKVPYYAMRVHDVEILNATGKKEN